MPTPARTPAERTLQARLAAHTLHSKVTDPVAHTAAARKAALDRFEREVDPDGTLDPAERARRAAHARKAYFTSLALKSAKARRKTGRGRSDVIATTSPCVDVDDPSVSGTEEASSRQTLA